MTAPKEIKVHSKISIVESENQAFSFMPKEFVSKSDYDQALADKDKEIADLKGELAKANDLLRSCYQVAARNGAQTNWEALIKNLEDTLKRQMEILK